MIDELDGLDGYPYLHAARADLRRARAPGDAAIAYRQTIALTDNAAEQRFLRRRLDETTSAA